MELRRAGQADLRRARWLSPRAAAPTSVKLDIEDVTGGRPHQGGPAGHEEFSFGVFGEFRNLLPRPLRLSEASSPGVIQ